MCKLHMSPCDVRCRWPVALALLPAVVTTGDAYLFDRLGGFSGGVLLAEPLLPASSLTRNTRNTRAEVALTSPDVSLAASGRAVE